MVSNRPMRLSLLGLALSFACFAMFDATSSRPSEFPSLPLPAPGLDAWMNTYASVGGKHELWVDVAVRDADSAFNVGEPIKCLIGVYQLTKSGPIRLAHSTLRVAATYPWGHLVSYSSEAFQLAPGETTIQVRNEGCAAGSAFQGGMMYLYHPSPVTFSLRFLWKLLGYALGLCSMSILAYGYAAARRRSQRENTPSS
jgi:hypothetical protein